MLDEVIEKVRHALALSHLEANLLLDHKNGEYVLSIHTKTTKAFKRLEEQV